jgi:hypothetical protein
LPIHYFFLTLHRHNVDASLLAGGTERVRNYVTWRNVLDTLQSGGFIVNGKKSKATRASFGISAAIRLKKT